MSQAQIQKLIETNEFVGSIHDGLLDSNNLSLAAAYNDACCWIAELTAQVRLLEKQTSAGFCRRDTSALRMTATTSLVSPVDEGDEWLKTGVSNE
jgi:hypothetical protein